MVTRNLDKTDLNGQANFDDDGSNSVYRLSLRLFLIEIRSELAQVDQFFAGFQRFSIF